MAYIIRLKLGVLTDLYMLIEYTKNTRFSSFFSSELSQNRIYVTKIYTTSSSKHWAILGTHLVGYDVLWPSCRVIFNCERSNFLVVEIIDINMKLTEILIINEQDLNKRYKANDINNDRNKIKITNRSSCQTDRF